MFNAFWYSKSSSNYMAGIFVLCWIQCSIQNLSWLRKTTLSTKNSLAMATEVSISVNLHFTKAVFAALGSLFLKHHLQRKCGPRKLVQGELEQNTHERVLTRQDFASKLMDPQTFSGKSFTLILYSNHHLQPSSHSLGLSAFAKSGNNGMWPMPWPLLFWFLIHLLHLSKTIPGSSCYTTIWPSCSLLWDLTSGSFSSRHSCSYCQQASVWTHMLFSLNHDSKLTLNNSSGGSYTGDFFWRRKVVRIAHILQEVPWQATSSDCFKLHYTWSDKLRSLSLQG